MKASENGAMNGCEPPYGCREPNPGLLKEHQALLTIAPPSLQPLTYSFEKVKLHVRF